MSISVLRLSACGIFTDTEGSSWANRGWALCSSCLRPRRSRGMAASVPAGSDPGWEGVVDALNGAAALPGNYLPEAVKGCVIVHRSHPLVLGVGPAAEGDAHFQWNSESEVFSVANTGSDACFTYLTFCGLVRDRNGDPFDSGVNRSECGLEQNVTTFVVVLAPKAAVQLGRLEARVVRSNFFALGLERLVDPPRTLGLADVEPLGFPLPAVGGPYLCTQGVGGHLSHFFPESYHAVDLRCDCHTLVLSVGQGVVKEVQESHHCSGVHAGNLAHWNSICVLLQGGLLVEYLHTLPGTARVKVGDIVSRGQALCETGDIGFAPEPHLHIELHDASAAEGPSVPLVFGHEARRPFVPVAGRWYSPEGEVQEGRAGALASSVMDLGAAVPVAMMLAQRLANLSIPQASARCLTGASERSSTGMFQTPASVLHASCKRLSGALHRRLTNVFRALLRGVREVPVRRFTGASATPGDPAKRLTGTSRDVLQALLGGVLQATYRCVCEARATHLTGVLQAPLIGAVYAYCKRLRDACFKRLCEASDKGFLEASYSNLGDFFISQGVAKAIEQVGLSGGAPAHCELAEKDGHAGLATELDTGARALPGREIQRCSGLRKILKSRPLEVSDLSGPRPDVSAQDPGALGGNCPERSAVSVDGLHLRRRRFMSVESLALLVMSCLSRSAPGAFSIAAPVAKLSLGRLVAGRRISQSRARGQMSEQGAATGGMRLPGVTRG
ncbi:unnamed protein product [Prorocentrum cordatum]|uniref:M23ase beta-sheet core domain-containing protein n=1 Tax=Prorocentrum cordatum TaxID=2364126 RepID=A0ABN9UAR1_9DINO|nr:unnamed protein product [Polarella glacialis]